MFTFKVETHGPYQQATLEVKTDLIHITFRPEEELPQYDLADPHAEVSEFVFDTTDGLVNLKWDKETVTLCLASYGVGKGDIKVVVKKVDNSLEQALTDWIQFEKRPPKRRSHEPELDEPKRSCVKTSLTDVDKAIAILHGASIDPSAV